MAKRKVSFAKDLTGVTLKSFDTHAVDIMSYKGRLVALVNGVLPLEVTSCMDSEGNDCDYSDATVVVAGSDIKGWVTVMLGEPYTGRMN